MFRPNKLILTSLTVFMIAALSSCNLVGQPAQPTTPTVDLTAIGTTIAATIQAELTKNAPTAVPTFTITPTGTATTAVVATNTQGIVPVEETSAITPTETALLNTAATPSVTPLAGEATATPSVTPLAGAATAIPSFTPIGGLATTPSRTPIAVSNGGGSGGPVCKNAAFDGDVTIPDGTVMKPWEKFEKVWAIKNTGTCRWDEGFSFAAWPDGAPSMGKNQSYQGKRKFATADRFIEPGAVAYMSIDMYAPGDPGTYVVHWQMYDDNGQPFGQDVVVSITVSK